MILYLFFNKILGLGFKVSLYSVKEEQKNNIDNLLEVKDFSKFTKATEKIEIKENKMYIKNKSFDPGVSKIVLIFDTEEKDDENYINIDNEINKKENYLGEIISLFFYEEVLFSKKEYLNSGIYFVFDLAEFIKTNKILLAKAADITALNFKKEKITLEHFENVVVDENFIQFKEKIENHNFKDDEDLEIDVDDLDKYFLPNKDKIPPFFYGYFSDAPMPPIKKPDISKEKYEFTDPFDFKVELTDDNIHKPEMYNKIIEITSDIFSTDYLRLYKYNNSSKISFSKKLINENTVENNPLLDLLKKIKKSKNKKRIKKSEIELINIYRLDSFVFNEFCPFNHKNHFDFKHLTLRTFQNLKTFVNLPYKPFRNTVEKNLGIYLKIVVYLPEEKIFFY